MSSVEVLSSSEWPTVTEFYTGLDIFITGVTGFMGKFLLEKLLRSFPNGGRIFVLVRPNKGKSILERIEELTSTQLFQHLRTETPEVMDRIVPIAGDINKPGLGISKEDEEILVGSVSIVFHLAASIRFNESLRNALQYNVISVREMVKLCHKMKKLQSLVHVSTAYANCHLINCDEIIYPLNVQYDKLLDLLDWMTDEQLDLLLPTFLQGRPNTYTFAKAVAETLLQNEAKDLPVAIFRPSVIGTPYHEPLPGYVDSLQGPPALLVACGKGVLRTMAGKRSGVLDLVPVDYCNNMVIVIGWITALDRASNHLIYNYNTTALNPMKYRTLYYWTIETFNDKPFEEIYRRPWMIHCRPAFMWPVFHFVLHLVPGFFADILLRLSGKEPIMLKTYRKLYKAVSYLAYFLQIPFTWSHHNYHRLLSKVPEEERDIFNFDVTRIDWRTYVEVGCIGAKKYLFNEDMSNVHLARQNIKRRRNIRCTIDFIMFLLGTCFLYRHSRIARETLSSVLGMCLKWLKNLKMFFSEL